MFDADSVDSYLRRTGRLAPAARTDVRALGGGVSNEVFLITVDDGPDLVLKQAREKLNVEADWHLDPRRANNEARCLRYLNRILPPGSAPEVCFVDDAECLLGMSRAPLGGVIWKDELLAGEVSIPTARRVGSMLATIHSVSADDPAIARDFAHPDLLEKGRVEPYHRAVARRHPDLAAIIDVEIERLTVTRRALVLGDVSPKNIFVYPDRVFFFDVEIAHHGDPAFDIAFVLTHLLIKSIVVSEHRGELLTAAGELWTAYRGGVPDWPDLERGVVAEVGCLLLARVDGKSPVEYLRDEKDRLSIRKLARSILLDPPADPDLLLGVLEEHSPRRVGEMTGSSGGPE